jgi:hypothetical protein
MSRRNRGYTVGYKRRPTPADVTRALKYDFNASALSHKHHRVEKPVFYGPFANAADFVKALKDGLEWFNSRPGYGRPILRAAIERFVHFARGTYLNEEERSRVTRAVMAILEVHWGAVTVWHVHVTNGEADLHVLLPCLVWHPLPIARPAAATNLPKLLVRGVAKLVAEFDATRLELGLPLIGFSAGKSPEKVPAPAKVTTPEQEIALWDDDESLLPLLKKKAHPKTKPGPEPKSIQPPSL